MDELTRATTSFVLYITLIRKDIGYGSLFVIIRKLEVIVDNRQVD